MEFNEFQQLALRTAPEDELKDNTLGITLSALGLAGEAGEFADLWKKLLFHGHEWTTEAQLALVYEVGDVLWYCAIAAHSLGVSLGDIAKLNIEKLNKRYPDGFSSERSRTRPENGLTEASTAADNVTGVWIWRENLDSWWYNTDNGHAVIRAAAGPRRPWLIYLYDTAGNEMIAGSSPSIDDAKSSAVRQLHNLDV